MMIRMHVGCLLVVLAAASTGCDSSSRASLPTSPSPLAVSTAPPSPSPSPAASTLIVFTEPATGFSTSELRDVQEQVLQVTTANELIWTADGTRLPGYRVDRCCYPGVSFIVGNICREGCAFEVRFGSRDGERRAYLTVDYGHDNPGTLVDVEVVGGALLVARTDVFVPGTFTLSGVVTDIDGNGLRVPVAGVSVYRGVVSGWRQGITDHHGFYSISGMFNGTEEVTTRKDGYANTRHEVSIDGDTRFDIELVRQ